MNTEQRQATLTRFYADIPSQLVCDNCGEPIFSYKPDSTLIASDGDEDRPFRWGIDCSCGKRRGW